MRRAACLGVYWALQVSRSKSGSAGSPRKRVAYQQMEVGGEREDK